MPWNGVLSSLWNQAKLYKRALADQLAPADFCFICSGLIRRSEGSLCEGCLTDLPSRPAKLKRQIKFVDAAFAVFRYEFPITEVVKSAKFHGDLAALTVLAAGFSCEFLVELEAVDFMVPVPLLPWRFMRRGYNQSGELARLLGERTGIALRHDVVKRRQPWGRTQSLLDAAARRANVKSAFQVTGKVTGARIAIVDDVITTGATCAALAAALRAAGASRVIVVAAAATPRRRDLPEDQVSRLVTLKA